MNIVKQNQMKINITKLSSLSVSIKFLICLEKYIIKQQKNIS